MHRLAAAILGGALLFAFGAEARAFKTVHSFCGQAQCRDGIGPSGLLIDGGGNLYGATTGGGTRRDRGTIFEMVGGTHYKVLYRFCRHGSCADGAAPNNPLIADTAGNLYGTTSIGGAHDSGTVFELSPNIGRTVWTLSVLHDFCSTGGSACSDGAFPAAGLTYTGAASGVAYDGVSPLYGTTAGSGASSASIAFSLAPGTPWTQTVLYTFCSLSACADGFQADGPLLVDGSGNLFGTTFGGGAQGAGTVFELSSGGGGWGETVLHSFCASAGCADGASPAGGLIADATGNLYGTTINGGRACTIAALSGYSCGVIFKLVPAGVSSTESVLHAFCARSDCKDGAFPDAGLAMDSSGNLYGTAQYGGGHDGEPGSTGGGTAFELSGSSLHVLHAFCALAQCADGEAPNAALVMNSAGALFGTAPGGGGNGIGGTVFRIVPSP